MRDIKFRAWVLNYDSHEYEMYHWCRYFFSDCSPVTGYGDDFPEDATDVILMQYTGLQDKKGAEIYEGDIIAYNVEGTNEKTWISVILWKDGCLIIEREEIPLVMDGTIYNIVIIGNIYENPELIKR